MSDGKIKEWGGFMKIINLMENTEGRAGCIAVHGLSFYIETQKHKLLMDLGPSEDTLANAKALGIDLSLVDTVILSHGHYDHSGGILPFVKLNDTAKIYIQKTAFADYYAYDGSEKGYRYIGIDKEIMKLPQVVFVEGDLEIDEELFLFSKLSGSYPIPRTNKRLMELVNGTYVQDTFGHEQCLVVREGDRRVLFSGCAHSGILNILKRYEALYGSAPDMVISGFHMMKKTEYDEEEIRTIIETAKLLKQYPTKFYTGHCTGVPAYAVMKKYMKEQLVYVHSGEEIRLEEKCVGKRRRSP